MQGGDVVGAVIWKREMGVDQGDAQGPDGISPLGGATDHGYDGETQGSKEW